MPPLTPKEAAAEVYRAMGDCRMACLSLHLAYQQWREACAAAEAIIKTHEEDVKWSAALERAMHTDPDSPVN